MDQKERLRYLTSQFIKDSEQYSGLTVPENPEEQRALLRSLMNIRMPHPMDTQVLRIQDEYLREHNRENGIVSLSDIPSCASCGSTVPHASQIHLWQGDITRLAADAIVNAANSQMLGCFIPMHACIDNCIHTYAGIQLRAECARQMRQLRKQYGNDYEQPVAVPMLTGGYNLPAEHVIHVTGPIVTGRLTRENEQQLSDCYRNVMNMCVEHDLHSVAFCCISTGVFRFPNRRAAEIAAETVTEWLQEHPGYDIHVIFNVFKDEDRQYYEEVLYNEH
ncbi:MAG: protein-ADP-ribose hydrolase [Solobacterium sp.]|nr:protein-ADP-ribose hydrolase [Solobacterium sp.]